MTWTLFCQLFLLKCAFLEEMKIDVRMNIIPTFAWFKFGVDSVFCLNTYIKF